MHGTQKCLHFFPQQQHFIFWDVKQKADEMNTPSKGQGNDSKVHYFFGWDDIKQTVAVSI